MSSDLDRFLHAVRTLAKLAHKYRDEDFIESLGRYATVKQEGEVWFVGTFCDDIGRELHERLVESRCRQCGGDICNDDRDVRADAQYCSAKCRQKAHRSRVTASTTNSGAKRNENDIALRLEQQKRQRAVTAPAKAEVRS
jgi:hypothetical protein